MNLILILAIVLMNLIAFVLYGIDKKRAVRDQYRISEKALLGIAFFGGSVGALMGMFCFHHKTRHLKFRILLPLFLVLHCVLIGWCRSKSLL